MEAFAKLIEMSKFCFHNDIKPGNMMFNAEGEIFFIDFGLIIPNKGPASSDFNPYMQEAVIGTSLYDSYEKTHLAKDYKRQDIKKYQREDCQDCI